MLVPLNSRLARKDFNDWISRPFSPAARYLSMASGPLRPGVLGSKYKTERYVSVVPSPALNRMVSAVPLAVTTAMELLVVPKSIPTALLTPYLNAFKAAAVDQSRMRVG